MLNINPTCGIPPSVTTGTTPYHRYDSVYTSSADVAFYLGLARSTGGPVLELGSGTGRTLLPIRDAGIPIDGLDNSLEYIQVLRAKVACGPPEAGSTVIHEADMRGFDLNRRYQLITGPFNALENLLTLQDQRAVLHSVRRHLLPGGIFAFDVTCHDLRRLHEPAEEREAKSWPDPTQPGITVKRFLRRSAVDLVNQILDTEITYRSYAADVLVSEDRSVFRHSFYTWPQIILLLQLTGFEVVGQYGSFAKDPAGSGLKQIFIARPAD